MRAVGLKVLKNRLGDQGQHLRLATFDRRMAEAAVAPEIPLAEV